MIIVCLIVFSFVAVSGGELHNVHDFFDFDCFLFNLVTISDGELHKVNDYCVLGCFLFCPFQGVSYIKCMIF